MDLFLILYILILMTLFFFLGAAIGGAARSFKSYFFGFKENEYYCCEAASAREHALVEGSTVGKAALATTALVAAADQAQDQDNIVKINQDEVRVDETKEWNGSEAPQDDQGLDIEAPVHRDEEANIERQTTNEDVAQPIATDEINHEEGFQEAAVVRDDETTPQDQGGAAPIEWDYTSDQMNYDDVAFHAEGPSDDLTLINGIDENVQSQLKELGLHQFKQIANLTEHEVGFLRHKFGFTSLLNEQGWIEQAQILAAGGATAFSQHQSDDEMSEDQAETTADDDSAYEQRFDYEQEDQAKGQTEEGDYESRFAYEDDEPQAADSEQQEVTEEPADASADDDSAYEQRFDYEQEDKAKTQPKEGDYESRFAYEGDEPQAVEGEQQEATEDQAETTADDDSAYEQRFDYEQEDQAKTQPEEGDYESRFAYEDDEPQAADSEQQEVTEEPADASAEDDSAYEQRFDYEQEDQAKGQTEEGDYESRFAYEGDDPQAVEGEQQEATEQNERHISREEGDDGRLFGEEARKERDEEWRERYQNERKILPPGQRGEQPQAAVEEAVIVSPAVDSDDLQQIKFISTGIEKKLNLLGVYKLSQIAKWSQEDVDHISEELEFKGRIEEEDWISQATQILAATQKRTDADTLTASNLNQGDHELDQLSDLTQDEKELLLSNGIARLSQIASWSGSNVSWVEDLLQIKDPSRIASWIETAKKAQTGHEVVQQERESNLEAVTILQTYHADHELDQLPGLTQDEKDLLLSNGIARLSQIASWSISDTDKAASLLQIEDPARLASWIEIAKKGQAGGQNADQSLEVTPSGPITQANGDIGQITDISQEEKQLLTEKGIGSLSQIANWSGADITWAGLLLGLEEKTRLLAWVEQAKQLVAGQEDEPTQASFSGQEDDLKRIRGIDAETETKLKEMGIMSYAQISQFQQTDMDKVNEVLGTSGRVERQYWVVQAKVLVDGGETDFSKLYDGSN